MKQTQTLIPETFLGVGYTREPSWATSSRLVRVSVPQPAADQVLIRVAACVAQPAGV